MEKTLTPADLRQFSGSETWYRHGLVRHILYTEGAQYVAEQGAPTGSSTKSLSPRRRAARLRANRFSSGRLRSARTALPSSPARMATAIRCSVSRSNIRTSRSTGIQLYLTNNTILLPSEH